MNKRRFDLAISLVEAERKRQFEKWGVQEHNVMTWLAILMEEVGEASQAALHDIFGGSAKGTFYIEMIHVAAVAVQILEWIIGGGMEDDTLP